MTVEGLETDVGHMTNLQEQQSDMHTTETKLHF